MVVMVMLISVPEPYICVYAHATRTELDSIYFMHVLLLPNMIVSLDQLAMTIISVTWNSITY